MYRSQRRLDTRARRSQMSTTTECIQRPSCVLSLPDVRLSFEFSGSSFHFKSERSLSPPSVRRSNIVPAIRSPRSYTVEAICAIAHPEPTHALATSRCMSHLLTGSKDGYIRDYDVFAAVNGKTFLTAPQRQHCSVIEGTMKAGQLRTWWENPATFNDLVEENSRSQVCSLLMQSDALWALAGSEVFSFHRRLCVQVLGSGDFPTAWACELVHYTA